MNNATPTVFRRTIRVHQIWRKSAILGVELIPEMQKIRFVLTKRTPKSQPNTWMEHHVDWIEMLKVSHIMSLGRPMRTRSDMKSAKHNGTDAVSIMTWEADVDKVSTWIRIKHVEGHKNGRIITPTKGGREFDKNAIKLSPPELAGLGMIIRHHMDAATTAMYTHGMFTSRLFNGATDSIYNKWQEQAVGVVLKANGRESFGGYYVPQTQELPDADNHRPVENNQPSVDEYAPQMDEIMY